LATDGPEAVHPGSLQGSSLPRKKDGNPMNTDGVDVDSAGAMAIGTDYFVTIDPDGDRQVIFRV
jgi:hypothetical protein